MTSRDVDPPRECAHPIDLPRLMDYWLAALAPADEEAVEEHLMACDRCGDRLRETIALAESLRRLARSASLRVVISGAQLERAAGIGQRVRQYPARPGGTVHCTVSAEDDVLAARLAADLTGAGRVDLRVFDAAGVERHRMADIPVWREAGEVILQESIAFAKASPSDTLIMRLVGVDAAGAEQLLGEYTFHHTRTIVDA